VAATTEPSSTPEIIDISADRNARSNRVAAAPRPTSAPATAAGATQDTTTAATQPPPQASAVVNSVLSQSLEPLLAGGRLGLTGAALSGAAWLIVHFLRRRA
jgi:hypothetical protein